MQPSDDRLVIETSRGERELSLQAELGAELAELAMVESNRWIKALRGLGIDGRTLRDRFLYRGDSLWWFTELYFHKTQVVTEIFRTLLALEAIVARYEPRSLRVAGGSLLPVLASEVARTRGLAYVGPRPPRRQRRAITSAVVRGYLYTWRARVAAWRAPTHVGAGRAQVAAFVHAAFWRSTGEQYTGPVLEALSDELPAGGLALIGVGPRTSYRARTWKNRVAEAGGRLETALPFLPVDAFARPRQLLGSREIWRARAAVFSALRRSEDIRSATVIRGCHLWPLIEPVFAGVAYLQFPWSAHVMDQLGAALDVLEPRTALTYAEAGGWGRALVLEARRRAIPTVGLQHGFIYRHWLNYLHETDEMQPSPWNADDRGFPAPTRTLVYDRFTARHLADAGRFDPQSVSVTGSPRLDDLVRSARALAPSDRERVRTGAGATPTERLVVVAAKYTQISRVFRDLVAAAASIPGVLLVVKCHPAEGPEPYLRDAAGSPSVRIAAAGADLAGLIASARLLVTVNSTAAVEAMVLGTPALVVSLPNNLSPFVEAGVMAGVREGDPIEPALREVLSDETRREALARRAEGFMRDNDIGSDGAAAARAARQILDLASPADDGEAVC